MSDGSVMSEMNMSEKVIRDWGDFFLRDDTEIRKTYMNPDDQIEGYSLFQRKPYGRVAIYGGTLRWALDRAEERVEQERNLREERSCDRQQRS